ncbi:hypothetical protein ACROYT_G017882 [Oculina patagonica]
MNPSFWSKPGTTSYTGVVRGETNSSDSDQDEQDQFAVSTPSWLQTFQTVGEDEAVMIALAETVLEKVSEETESSGDENLSHRTQGSLELRFLSTKPGNVDGEDCEDDTSSLFQAFG